MSREQFPWGRITQTHVIGEYEIVEFKPSPAFKSLKTDTTLFHVSYPGKLHTWSGQTAETLDQAIILSICLKQEGANTRAPDYIYKMLGLVHAA